MAAATLFTDEAEGERGDKGNDVDVRIGKEKVPELCRSKTLKGNHAERQLEPNEEHTEEEKSLKLGRQSIRFEVSCKDEYYAEGTKSADHAEDDNGGQEDLVPHAVPQLYPERPFEEDLVGSNNPRDERAKRTYDHKG